MPSDAAALEQAQAACAGTVRVWGASVEFARALGAPVRVASLFPCTTTETREHMSDVKVSATVEAKRRVANNELLEGGPVRTDGALTTERLARGAGVSRATDVCAREANRYTPGLEVEIARLRVAIGRLHRRMVRNTSGDLTFAQTSALVAVEKAGPIRLGELAAREGVTAPTMTRTVAKLEDTGLLERAENPQDGRSFRLSITGRGRALLESLRTESDAALTSAILCLSSTEHAALRTVLPVLERLVEGGGPDSAFGPTVTGLEVGSVPSP